MTEWEKFERLAFVMGEIARGRFDNGRPLAAETSRQMAREVLSMMGLGWPYCARLAQPTPSPIATAEPKKSAEPAFTSTNSAIPKVSG